MYGISIWGFQNKDKIGFESVLNNEEAEWGGEDAKCARDLN